jgi:GNAT superfamily N-acetyltransferase
LQVERVLSRIPDPHYLSLETAAGEVAAVIVSGRKTTIVAGRPCAAFHIAMVAVDANHAGKGLGVLISKHAKEFLFGLLGTEGLVYAYVESTHHKSIELHERLGYRRICDITARPFIRINPSAKAILRLEEHDRLGVVADLFRLYKDHALVDFNESVRAEEFFCIDNHTTGVGAQASLMNWSFEHLAGFADFVALRLLPALPMIEHTFNPHDLNFIRVGNILLDQTAPHLNDLLEGLLSHFDVHMAMLFLDKRSAINKTILGSVDWGIGSDMVTGSAAVVWAAKGLTEDDMAHLSKRPLLVSPIDAI